MGGQHVNVGKARVGHDGGRADQMLLSDWMLSDLVYSVSGMFWMYLGRKNMAVP